MQGRPVGVIVHDVGLLAEDQADGSVQADSCQRLISDIEQQYPTHRTSSRVAPVVPPGHP